MQKEAASGPRSYGIRLVVMVLDKVGNLWFAFELTFFPTSLQVPTLSKQTVEIPIIWPYHFEGYLKVNQVIVSNFYITLTFHIRCRHILEPLKYI